VTGVARARASGPGGEVPEARTPGLAAAWRALSRPLRALRARDRVRRVTDDPASMHTLLPFAILIAGSLLVPSVAARSLLFLTPFALWLAERLAGATLDVFDYERTPVEAPFPSAPLRSMFAAARYAAVRGVQTALDVVGFARLNRGKRRRTGS